MCSCDPLKMLAFFGKFKTQYSRETLMLLCHIQPNDIILLWFVMEKHGATAH